jgi:hypothetical protein
MLRGVVVVPLRNDFSQTIPDYSPAYTIIIYGARPSSRPVVRRRCAIGIVLDAIQNNNMNRCCPGWPSTAAVTTTLPPYSYTCVNYSYYFCIPERNASFSSREGDGYKHYLRCFILSLRFFGLSRVCDRHMCRYQGGRAFTCIYIYIS